MHAANAGDEAGLRTALALAAQQGLSMSKVKEPEEQSSALHLASKAGHAACMTPLLEAGFEAGWRAKNGDASLHLAAQFGHAACVRLLIAASADATAVNDGKVTPLYAACAGGHAECAKLLLDAGASTHFQRDDGTAPLHIACKKGHLACVELLLDADAPLEQRMAFGTTPLYVAVAYGQLECMRRLLARGADANAVTDAGATPLFVACEEDRAECAELLLQATRIPTTRHGWTRNCYACPVRPVPLPHSPFASPRALPFRLQASASPNATDRKGRTPLHVTAIKGSVHCTQILMASPGTDRYGRRRS